MITEAEIDSAVTTIRKTIYDALRAYDQRTGELVAMPDDEALTEAARAIVGLTLDPGESAQGKHEG